jgi:hypothetical protein
MGQSVLKGACALDQVGDEIVYPRTLFVGVTLGIFLTLPKAQSKDLVGLCIRHKENLIHETWLVFKHRDDPIVNGFCELSRFSRLGADGDDSSKHNVPPFRSGSIRNNVCSLGSRVNYRKMVQGASGKLDDFLKI